MKNKKLTYLLGVVVIAVWGLILYRIFSAANGNDDNKIQPAPARQKEAYNDYTIPKDTTHLLLNYRDPFGLTKSKDTAKQSTINHKGTKFAGAAKPIFDWGFIKYSGYIRNPGSKKLIAILSINGKEAMMAEGETAEKVRLLKNMRDSVKVSFNGKTKFITIH